MHNYIHQTINNVLIDTWKYVNRAILNMKNVYAHICAHKQILYYHQISLFIEILILILYFYFSTEGDFNECVKLAPQH